MDPNTLFPAECFSFGVTRRAFECTACLRSRHRFSMMLKSGEGEGRSESSSSSFLKALMVEGRHKAHVGSFCCCGLVSSLTASHLLLISPEIHSSLYLLVPLAAYNPKTQQTHLHVSHSAQCSSHQTLHLCSPNTPLLFCFYFTRLQLGLHLV